MKNRDSDRFTDHFPVPRPRECRQRPGKWYLSLFFCVLSASGAEVVAPGEARAKAIQQTLDAIQAELEAHGGSFEKWGESLKEFRDGVRKVQAASGWPWPAKKNFVFQGREVSLIMLDTLDSQPDGQRPYDVVLDTHKKLAAEGIDLIFVVLPDKLAIYPDYLSDKAPEDRMVYPAVKQLMKRLLESGVEVVDLHPAFHEARRKNEDRPLYYDKDSHWRNIAAQLAAEKIAERLRRYDFVQKALAGEKRYSLQAEHRDDKPDDLMVVLDSKTGGRYADAGQSPILITGDSALMYNMGTRGGHMPAHIGAQINMPISFASNTIPPEHFGKLAGRRVVIWANMARMLVGCKWPTRSGTPAKPGGK